MPLKRFPHHICGTCYWMSQNHFCIFSPEPVPVDSERWGCNFWECAGCNGPFDEQDADGEFIDHGACMSGVIEIVS